VAGVTSVVVPLDSEEIFMLSDEVESKFMTLSDQTPAFGSAASTVADIEDRIDGAY
jgi:hypothetical protein